VPAFDDRRCYVFSITDPYGRILGSLNRRPYISFQAVPSFIHEIEWDPFQIRYFSENLVAPGIEPGPLNLQAGTLITRPLKQSIDKVY
jgi:hypothetical protein